MLTIVWDIGVVILQWFAENEDTGKNKLFLSSS